MTVSANPPILPAAATMYCKRKTKLKAAAPIVKIPQEMKTHDSNCHFFFQREIGSSNIGSSNGWRGENKSKEVEQL